MATNKIATYGVKVDPKGAVSGSSRASTAIKGIGKTASRVKNQIFSLNGAMGALGAGAVMASVIKSAAGLESLKVRLKFLTGSTLDAGKAFDTMTGFASKVPFALEDIQAASPLLLTITDDIDELNGLLEMTGDIAAVSGLDFVKTAEQLQRAMASGIASADLFRERGVAAFLGFEQGVTYSADETKKKLNEMWEGNTTSAVGATKELAKTFQGQVSMMEDAWFKLKIQFSETGVFEMAKDVVVSITESLGKPETISSIKEFGKGVVSVGKAIGSAVASFMGLPEWVRNTGLVLALIGGTRARLALAGVTALALALDSIADSFHALNNIHGDLVDKKQIDLIKELTEESENLAKLKADVANSVGMDDMPDPTGMLAIHVQNQKDALLVSQDRVKALKEEIRLNWDLAMAEKSFEQFDPKQKPTPKGEVFNVYDFAKGGEADSRLKKFTKTMTKYKDSIMKITNVMTPLQKLEKERDNIIENFNEAYRNGIILDVEKASGIKAVNDEYQKAVQFMEDAKIEKKVAEMAKGMSDSITESIMNMGKGLGSFRDVLNSIFDDIAAKVIQANISDPIANALSGAIGSQAKGGGFFGDIFKGMFKAEGGTVTGNQPYIVGEQGAELFVPNKTGTVVPNGSGGGGSVTNINVNYSPQINALDPRTASIVIAENAPTVVGIVRQAFNRNGRAVAL